MDDRLPTRQTARRLVVSIAIFWATWGCVVMGAELGILGVILFGLVLVGMASGVVFYATLFGIWNQPFLLFAFPGFRREGLRWRIMMKLLSPRWLWQTIRATDWPAATIAVTLFLLLAGDLVLFGVLMSHPPAVQR